MRIPSPLLRTAAALFALAGERRPDLFDLVLVVGEVGTAGGGELEGTSTAFVVALEQALAPELDKVLPDPRGLVPRHQLDDGASTELAPYDSGPLENGKLAPLEAVEAACEQRLERGRHGLRLAGLARVREELLDEERVPASRSNHLLAQRGRKLTEVPDQRLGVLARERGERDRVDLGPVRARLEQLGPGQAQHEDRRIGDVGGEVLDQVEQRRLGPVDVVEDDDQRLLGRERLDQLANGPEDLLRRRAAAIG